MRSHVPCKAWKRRSDFDSRVLNIRPLVKILMLDSPTTLTVESPPFDPLGTYLVKLFLVLTFKFIVCAFSVS